MDNEEFQAFANRTPVYDAAALGNGRHLVSTQSRDKSPINFGNHSCDPNARSDDRGLLALRQITSGEEITSDYSLVSSREWSMKCNCGTTNCRGIVRGTL
jgi:uncharacterized protein